MGLSEVDLSCRDLRRASSARPTRPRRFDERPVHRGSARPLVVIYLRGGADGLALVPPLNAGLDQERPDLWVAPDAITADFGLHPALKLAPLFREGRLQIVHAVGILDRDRGSGTRSHFASQAELARSGSRDRSGWLGRHLQSHDSGTANPLRAVVVGPRVPADLHGPVPVTVLPSLKGQQLPVSPKVRGRLEDALRVAYAGSGLEAQACHALDTAARLRDLPTPGEGAGLVGQVELAATLLKAGTELVWIDDDGWDMHAGQPPAMKKKAGALGSALRRLDRRTRALDVTAVVLTEFGRRVAQNGSRGTDHGAGGVMFLMGEGLSGIQGRWPGIAPADRVGPGDLAITTDHREVLARVLRDRVGNPVALFNEGRT